MLAAGAGFVFAGDQGGSAEYLGGTLDTLCAHAQGTLVTTDPISLVFLTKKTAVRIPYERINQIEYGQHVDRRLLEAALLSPLFLLSKKRAHFLTIGFEGEDGRQQALVFRVEKNAIRPILVALEARTGRKVVFQDEEARKSGKG
jgi:hypothetical protein